MLSEDAVTVAMRLPPDGIALAIAHDYAEAAARSINRG
jgi:hypothetical protein